LEFIVTMSNGDLMYRKCMTMKSGNFIVLTNNKVHIRLFTTLALLILIMYSSQDDKDQRSLWGPWCFT